jgi:hypothetical protein
MKLWEKNKFIFVHAWWLLTWRDSGTKYCNIIDKITSRKNTTKEKGRRMISLPFFFKKK